MERPAYIVQSELQAAALKVVGLNPGWVTFRVVKHSIHSVHSGEIVGNLQRMG